MSATHETKQHGTLSFPFTVYGAIMPEMMTSFPLHWHDELELIYLHEGSVCVSIQNTDHILSPGEIAVIQPQMLHSIRQNRSDIAVYFNVLFRLSLLENSGSDICYEKYIEPVLSRRLMLPRYISREHKLYEPLGEAARILYGISTSDNEGQELLIKAQLFTVMYYLINLADPVSEEDIYINSLHEKLKKTISFVQSNYSEEISVADAAAVSNFSSSHFSKIFRQFTGLSFTQYLKSYRLEMASRRLQSPDSRISDTALRCGFSNLSYFTRAFKDKYGMTPQQYKEKMSR